MGVYDSVIFECPSCEEDIEVQSKAMPNPYLRVYTTMSVPSPIALDLVDKVVECPNCEQRYMLYGPKMPQVVNMMLIPTDDEANLYSTDTNDND